MWFVLERERHGEHDEFLPDNYFVSAFSPKTFTPLRVTKAWHVFVSIALVKVSVQENSPHETIISRLYCSDEYIYMSCSTIRLAGACYAEARISNVCC